MKVFRLSILAVAALGLAALSGRRAPAVFVPRPEVVMAENKAVVAHSLLFEMNYADAASTLRDVESILTDIPRHHRWRARTFLHLGDWEEAARQFARAASDSTIRSAIESDLERLRALDMGPARPAPAAGQWRKLTLSFAQNMDVGAACLLSGGLIATAAPHTGTVHFWNSSGRRIRQVSGLGRIVSLAPRRADLLVADMAGDALHVVSTERGVLRSIPLGPLGVSGVRAVHAGTRDEIWLADYGNGRILRISETGDLITEIKGDGIAGPTAVVTIGDEILVAESGRDRVLRFDRNGRLLRFYNHPSMRNPVGLALTSDGVLVQAENGLVFWLREQEEDLTGPLRTPEGILTTSSLGLITDDSANLWWGDGFSLRFAERLPASHPAHLVEIVRIAATRGSGPASRVSATVSVMTRTGEPLDTLDRSAFRLLREQNVIEAFAVENLSRTLPGRRLVLVVESSDALLSHVESIRTMLGDVFGSLTPSDRTAVLDVTDTFHLIRPFAASPDLVRHAAFAERPRAAAIDLQSAPAVEFAIRLLAPTDFARAIVWVTSGDGLATADLLRIRRMGIINQVPVFILHAGTGASDELRSLAEATHGAYFQLYTNVRPADLAERLATIRSGRYRVSGRIPLPLPEERGEWMNVTCEVRRLGESAFDRVGYYSF